MAYTEPRQRKKEECERLGGEGDKIKFIHFRFGIILVASKREGWFA